MIFIYTAQKYYFIFTQHNVSKQKIDLKSINRQVFGKLCFQVECFPEKNNKNYAISLFKLFYHANFNM